MASKRVGIEYPSKGISENFGFSVQEEMTCRDERNMRTRDPRTGRLRGAQRAGLGIYQDQDAALDGSNKVRALAQVSSATNALIYSSLADGTAQTVANNAGDAEGVPILSAGDDFGNLYVVYRTEDTQPAYRYTLKVYNLDGETNATYEIPTEEFADAASAITTSITAMCVDRYQNVILGSSGNFTNHIVVFSRNISGEYEVFNKLAIDTVTNSAADRVVGLAASRGEAERDVIYAIVHGDFVGDITYAKASEGQNVFEVRCIAWDEYQVQSEQYTLAGAWNVQQRPVGAQDVIGTNSAPTDFAAATTAQGLLMTLGITHVTGNLDAHPNANRAIGVITAWNDRRAVFSIVVRANWSAQLGASVKSAIFSESSYLQLRNLDDTANLTGTQLVGGGVSLWHGYAGEYTEGTERTMSLGDAGSRRQSMLTINNNPGVNDALVIVGPKVDDPSTNGTLTIRWVSGGGAPTILTAPNSVTIELPLSHWSSLGSGLSNAWKYAYIMTAWASYARSNLSVNYNGNGPNVWITGGFSSLFGGILSITHPDPSRDLGVGDAYFKAVETTNNFTTLAHDTPTAFNLTAGNESEPQANVREWGPGFGNEPFYSAISQIVTGGVAARDNWWLGIRYISWLTHSGTAPEAYERKFLPSVDRLNTIYVPSNRASDTAAYNNKQLVIDEDAAVLDFALGHSQATLACVANYPVLTAIETDGINHTDLMYAVSEPDTGVTGDPSMYLYRLISIVQPSTVTRSVHTIAACNDKLLKLTATGPQSPNNNAVLDNSSPYVSMAAGFQRIYIADGSKYWVYDPLDTEVSDYGNITELLSTSITIIPPRCRLVTTWRDRVVLARDPADPGRWHMSAVGEDTNWDFFPANPTSTQAVTSTNTAAGRVPDIINAVIPWTNDTLLYGGDRTLWQLSGDPAAGGVLDLISQDTGVAFGKAWCTDPEGNLWYFGNTGGLYFLQQRKLPVRVSLTRVEEQLRSIDLSSYYIELQYNPVDEGVHIFQIPFGSGGAIVDQWFYEIQSGAWHKDRFGATATDLIQPTATLNINGDQASDRAILVGGEDGRVRYFSSSQTTVAKSDAKTNSTNVAIDSYVLFGPLVDNPIEYAQQVSEYGAVLSSSQDGCNFEVFTTDNPEVLGDPVARGRLSPGRNDRNLVRASGDHVYIRLRNASVGESWAYEGGSLTVSYAGDVRR
jgi:hypothetical protein